MTKLNTDLRKKIYHMALDDTFDKEFKAFRTKEGALALEVWESMVDLNQRKALSKIDSKFISHSSTLRVNARGWTVLLRLDKAMPDKWGYESVHLTDEAMIERVRKHAQDEGDMLKRHTEGQKSLWTMLTQATTFEQLATAWPEGKEYYAPVLEQHNKKTLPVIDVANVNKALGLPKA